MFESEIWLSFALCSSHSLFIHSLAKLDAENQFEFQAYTKLSDCKRFLNVLFSGGKGIFAKAGRAPL